MQRLFIPLALLILLGCSRTVPWMSDSEAVERAHASVLEHLKSPATAVFSNDSVGLFDSTLCVRGNVDSQNEFGALMRNRFLVVFEPKEPHRIYIGSVAKTYWGTHEDSLNSAPKRTKRITDINMELFTEELDGSSWLKSGEFFPEHIKGRTKEDSARAVEYLKSVLFDLDIATIDGELFDSTEVDAVHRARLRWKP